MFRRWLTFDGMVVREAYRRGNVNMKCHYGASSLLSDILLLLSAFCGIFTSAVQAAAKM